MSRLKSSVLEFQSDRLSNFLDGYDENVGRKWADLRTMNQEMTHEEHGRTA
jgi:hypothetical protein